MVCEFLTSNLFLIRPETRFPRNEGLEQTPERKNTSGEEDGVQGSMLGDTKETAQ